MSSESSAGAPHPFHMVTPSPWPAVGALAAFVTAFGAVTWFHDRAQPWVLMAGVALVLVTMAGWWAEVLREGRSGGAHTGPVRHGLRVGMALFIASEVMFFVAFFWAFFNAALKVNPSVMQWPPQGIEPLHTWGLPFVNTLILLSSGLAVTWAHHGLKKGNRTVLKAGLAVALVLGVVFLTLQAVEYGEAAFGFTEGVYPTVFYMATGFHGFHVLVGACFLAVCLGRALKGGFTPSQHVGFEAAAWYWHFVDVVWIFLFVWVYWWGNA
ncbi:cytochrome c oxidase subunit 3 [Magnetospirillum sp. UT-4]|uniref:cytochrome c oxidase subunit 3 n=1 Tax=Magnetospirillum sp. UT-4 TaxID=2681467 RepID=UPI001382EA83|nr:cytochrome c oxidase subunit 3 [Magnetospirillum sp. UT-4]CAA7613646.1 Cytochrome c oxidase subunit 3 [Magnetospirillum sp. UT-4]